MNVVETELVNKVLPFHQVGMGASDWIAILALLVALIGLLCQIHSHRKSLKWQNKIRIQDLERQRKEKLADDKMRKWSAEYPHKLKLITDFYDTLFRLINYKGSVEKILANNGTQNKLDVRIRVSDIMNFLSQINRIDEESQIIFKDNKQITQNIHSVWKKVKSFIENPLNNEHSLAEIESTINNIKHLQTNDTYIKLEESLKNLQKELKEYKILDTLRKEFQDSIQLKDGQI